MSRLLNKLADRVVEKKKEGGFPYPPRPKLSDKKAKDLEKAIKTWAKLQGYACFKIDVNGTFIDGKWYASCSDLGFPDLSLTVTGGIHIPIEVKVGKDTMSDDQKKVKNAYEAVGCRYFIARNFDDTIEELEEYLSEIGVEIENPLTLNYVSNHPR